MAELVKAPDGIFPKSLMILYYSFFVLQGLISILSGDHSVISVIRLLLGLIGLLSTRHDDIFLTYSLLVSIAIFSLSLILTAFSLLNMTLINSLARGYLFYLGSILIITIGWYYLQTTES